MTRDQERVEALAQYGLLVEPPGRDLQALVELAAQIFDVPSCALNIISDTQQHQVATTGFEASICSREDSMCAAVLENTSPVIVSDASVDSRFRANPFVTGEIGDVRFYASAPLVTPAGVVIGRLCVFDDQPREVTPQQTSALQVLADRVVDVLELRLRSRSLEQSLAELTHARDELRLSNERLSLFASQVSHDLRTPLTAIVLNTEVATQEPTVQGDPYLAQLLEGTLSAGNRMATLVDRILENARVGSTLHIEEVDLRSALADVVSDLGPTLRERGTQLVVEELPSLPGDRAQLYSVLLNLLSNAVKFTPPGRTPYVVVRARDLGDAWRIEVSDNGVGVAPENRERVFELFAREDGGVAGTGIGLANVKHIVTSHGGRVGLDPGDDEGTTAWFELPRRSPISEPA